MNREDPVNMRRAVGNVRFAFLLLPAAFFFIAYLLPLGERVMIRPDEFRYAEIPREMLTSGDWKRPRLNGVRYFEKPTLGYHITAVCMKYLGETPLAARLPSAAGTLLAAATVYLLCRRESRDPILPGLAAGMFLSFALVLGVGTFAVLDAPFSGLVTVCMGAAYLAWKSKSRTGEALLLVIAGTAAGLAFMIKGFLGFALPCVVIAPFLLWNRSWKKLLWWPYLPLAAAAAVSARWAWELHQAEPDFWRYFFVEEHWKRFTSATYDRKAQPFWYFIPVLLGGMMPAGLLWFAAWPGVMNIRWLKKPFFRYLLCWLIVPFLFFSASSCKLGTYILPVFPPLAILTASALRRSMLLHRERYRIYSVRIYRGVGTVFAVAAAAALLLLSLRGAVFRPLCGQWIYPTLLCMAILGALLCLVHRKRDLTALTLLVFGTAPLVCCGMLALSDGLPDGRMPERAIASCAKILPVDDDCVIAVERTCIAPVCWTLKRADLVVAGRMGEMTYGFTNYPEHRARFFKNDEFPRLLRTAPEGKVVYITFKDLEKSPLPRDWPSPKKRITVNGVTALRF